LIGKKYITEKKRYEMEKLERNASLKDILFVL